METQGKDERVEALRQDPDFRALVSALKAQTPEQVELFYSRCEHSEHEGDGEV
jgi:hypothetical protein